MYDAVSGSSPAKKNLNQVRRHDSYYLKGGDLHILVDDVLFRVHRYFFVRESSYFREELEFPASPGQSAKGTEDSNAIIIGDDQQGRAIHSTDFEKFLWVFYNPSYSLYEASIDDWSRILHLANTWCFHEVKNLCVRELQKLSILPVDRIYLYQEYEVDQVLLVPYLSELCSRETALSVEEGRKLGMQTAMKLMQARERARARDGTRSPLPADIREQEIVALVEDVFDINEPESEPSTPPVTSGSANGTCAAINGHTSTPAKNKSLSACVSKNDTGVLIDAPPVPSANPSNSISSSLPKQTNKDKDKDKDKDKENKSTTSAANTSLINGQPDNSNPKIAPATHPIVAEAAGAGAAGEGTESGNEEGTALTNKGKKGRGNNKAKASNELQGTRPS